jgi:DNA modification methylase
MAAGVGTVSRHYWSDSHTTLYQGDARQVFAEMPSRSVHCVVTSLAGSGKYTDAAVPLNGRSHGSSMLPTGRRHDAASERGRNVWSISTRPLREAHFVAILDLPLQCIAAGCRPGGTTGIAARQRDRNFVGIELVPEYCELIKTRFGVATGAMRRQADGEGGVWE